MSDEKRLQILGNLIGADGYTPQKGIDYFTVEDKDEFVGIVMEALPKAEGVSFPVETSAYRKVNENSLTSIADAIHTTYDITDQLEFPNGFVDAIRNGMSVNFDVKRYASETDLPETAKENTIAFITDIEMPSYSFVGDSTPVGDFPNGKVVIRTGSDSIVSFNVLRKNELYVNPVSMIQYIDGKWTNLLAYIYQNGQWVQFSYLMEYLYNKGETPYEWVSDQTLDMTDTELVMLVRRYLYNNGYGDYGYVYIDGPIVIPSGFTKLAIRYYCTGSMTTSSTAKHALVIRNNAGNNVYCTDNGIVASVSIPPTTDETVVYMDIPSSLYGQSLYVGVFYNSGANSYNEKDYHIKSIWFE